MTKDYYQILGIKKDASKEDIKKAYRKLAHEYHPDKKGGNEAKFKEINEAYQILSDEQKKQQYDRFGRTFEGAAAGNAGGFNAEPGFDFQWAWGKPGGGRERDFDFEDISDFGGMNDLSSIMEEMFGFGGQRGGERGKKDIKNGKDIRIDIEIPLKEVMQEQKKNIILEKMSSCSRCQGKGAEPGTPIKECFSCRGVGYVQQIRKTFLGSFTQRVVCPECKGEGNRPEKSCNVCMGEGRIKGNETITFSIPAGVDANQVIKMEGKGDAGRRGGRPGNLYIRISVGSHPVFQRKADDLISGFPISFSQAVLGGEIKITTIDEKKISIKIPSGTQSGKILRVSGEGIPHFSGRGRGDLYIQLTINTPQKITKAQKDLLEKLKEEGL
ncbi:molecular chaperone DnaJ [Candidatus Parcubacteria bacterium A4]|nr:MAG: molecular chaperone DnaJ [Candidatus Parcubacteria bacterium A4]